MSSTNRGGERIENDAYYTPEKLAEAIVDHLPIQKDHSVLEPHGGGGSFVQALRKKSDNVMTFDIDPRTVSYLARTFDVTAVCTNFLDYDSDNSLGFDWIVGNPPYRDAQAHVEQALNLLKPEGSLVFLLRLGFLESKKRYEFWQNNQGLRRVIVLSERPSFTGGATDSCAYGVFWWSKPWLMPPTLDIMSWK